MDFKDDAMRHRFNNHIKANVRPDAVVGIKLLNPKDKTYPAGLRLKETLISFIVIAHLILMICQKNIKVSIRILVNKFSCEHGYKHAIFSTIIVRIND